MAENRRQGEVRAVMDNELVSAVITTYNRRFPMLCAAIESVLAQTYQNIELIVISDNIPGSEIADEIAREMRAYPQVDYFQLPEHKGGQFARNTGINRAKGAYIAFLDDDDLWLPEKTEKSLRAFADPQIGLVFCRGWVFPDDDTDKLSPYGADSAVPPIIRFEDELITDYIGATSRVMARRECFERVGYFDEEMPARQDYEMWLRITQVWGATRVDDYLFKQREHGGGRISMDPGKTITACRVLRRKYDAVYRKNRAALCALYWNASWRGPIIRTRHRYIFLLRAFCASPKAFYQFYRKAAIARNERKANS